MNNLVARYVAAHQPEMLADLVEACRIPSVSAQPGPLADMAAWVADRLRRAGCHVSLWDGEGGPAVVWGQAGEGRRSLLSYSHYDVQPADPIDQWLSPPFEPSVREGKLFARGVSDDKGDFMSRIHAVEVHRAVYGELPLRLKLLIEGEEEIGNPHLEPVAATHARELRSDGVLWESGGFGANERYTLYLGMKGIQYVELRCRGANTDLHSAYAPIVPNPAWRLVWALNSLKAPDETILIDGFQDYVRPITSLEAGYLDTIPFAAAERKAQWGIEHFVGHVDEREGLRRYLFAPTCTICGFRSGFIDEGEKTVLPSEASVKLDFRLVPDLTPSLLLDLLRQHLDRHGFSDIEILPRSGMLPARSRPDADIVQAAIATARDVYGHEPVVYPSSGGSGPMYPLVQGLGMDSVSAGVAYAGVNMHAPNENIRLDDYFQQVVYLVELFRRFGEGDR